jgi:hypothetical protein
MDDDRIEVNGDVLDALFGSNIKNTASNHCIEFTANGDLKYKVIEGGVEKGDVETISEESSINYYGIEEEERKKGIKPEILYCIFIALTVFLAALILKMYN